MTKNKIILYGHFGSGNIGNDSSFEAALFHARKYRPDADLICVCNGPQEITSRFGIEALHMSGVHADESVAGGLVSKLKRVLMRLTDEIQFWMKRPSWYRPGDLFIVVGTGAVDDMAVRRPWHSPYELYKWCKTARMGGAKVVFLSVGVGPIMNRVSRFLMLKALNMAQYRSYREKAAFDYLQGIGYDTTGDLLYPDLVFSLPYEALPATQKSRSSEKVIGLGLINYYGWRHDPAIGESVYQEYFSKIKQFSVWLLKQGFHISIISGDTTDMRPVQELSDFLTRSGEAGWQEKVSIGKLSNVGELLEQIAQTDMVVASRFHNVLCSLMLERPVISLGYHEKNNNLMADMGLESYCQHIENFTVEKLVEQLECYQSDLAQAMQQIHNKNEQYRQSLDEQYREVLLPTDIKTSSI
jgi:polysaccharide pyruvyl transferase WcaK-like protein